MDSIDMNSMVDLALQIKWKSQHAEHTEGYAARNVNLWRDWLPQGVRESLLGKQAWERTQVDFKPGELFGSRNDPFKIDRRRFSMQPYRGRFYPKGRLSGLPGVFPQNMQPFRCTAINNGHMEVDTDHPLASYPLNLSMTIGQVNSKDIERGGSSVDWVGLLTEGPGMQARWNGVPTDFFSGKPFSRKDESDDAHFYGAPRLVHHLDETARDLVSDLYDRFIGEGMSVLDLMSSWTSHLPEKANPSTVSGIGMNRTELEQNPVLTDIRIHDLNTDPVLPYPNAHFDVAVCTASVEYLVDPIAVFSEVARVLKPNGAFVVTFSNRWFPTKSIQLWEELHEFERVGLVTEYFLHSGQYDRLRTYSMRGLPRPKNDKYAGDLLLSDPVYAVWGYKMKSSR